MKNKNPIAAFFSKMFGKKDSNTNQFDDNLSVNDQSTMTDQQSSFNPVNLDNNEIPGSSVNDQPNVYQQPLTQDSNTVENEVPPSTETASLPEEETLEQNVVISEDGETLSSEEKTDNTSPSTKPDDFSDSSL